MCYLVCLSTDSSKDLSLESDDYVHFEKKPLEGQFAGILEHENKWYVGSKSGCGCTFRHLTSVELGFGEPVEWYEEEEYEIAATLSFIKVVRRIVQEGYRVDCIDAWQGVTSEDIGDRTVNLAAIQDRQFRFFENYHFIFVADEDGRGKI